MPARVAHRPIVIAHRGLHVGGRPHENTLGAFDAAFDTGAEAVELDVRRTRDGVLVVHHDPITPSGQRIADTDFADLAVLPDGRRIPTLVEALDLVKRRRRQAVVEIKERGYELAIAAQVASRLPLEQVRFLSFEPDAVRVIEQAMPAARTGVVVPWIPDWLRDGMAELEHAIRGPHAAITDAQAGADFIVVHHLFAARTLREARERGLEVFIATPDTAVRLARWLDDPRVAGVLTNRADLAAQVRATRDGT